MNYTFPNAQYACVVIDPPWPMKKIQRKVAPNQVDMDYPLMTISEIRALDIPAILLDDAWVFLWTIQKYLSQSFAILGGWNLTHRYTMIWHKPGGFQPYNSPQFNAEFVAVGSKGNPQLTSQKDFNTCFMAARGKHSVKPQTFYDTLMRVTAPPRIDLFNRRPIYGFERWGNEANDDNQLLLF